MKTKFTLCESLYASGHGKWHIRKLTTAGKKLGGGIDTKSLCGKVDKGWDLNVEMTQHHLDNNTCPECLSKYRESK